MVFTHVIDSHEKKGELCHNYRGQIQLDAAQTCPPSSFRDTKTAAVKSCENRQYAGMFFHLIVTTTQNQGIRTQCAGPLGIMKSGMVCWPRGLNLVFRKILSCVSRTQTAASHVCKSSPPQVRESSHSLKKPLKEVGHLVKITRRNISNFGATFAAL